MVRWNTTVEDFDMPSNYNVRLVLIDSSKYVATKIAVLKMKCDLF